MGFLRFLIDNRLFLLAGALLSFTSSFGQTYFIAIFADEIMGAFDLSHGQWGGIYTLGTGLSAAVMVWAGALTDRFRVRALAVGVAIGLAIACLAMAAVPGPLALVAVVFALRFFGQGMMSTLAIVSMARWFVAARGRALSISTMGFYIGQAVLPMIFVSLLALTDWRMLWVVAAAVVVLTMPLTALLLRQERTPQSLASDAPVAGMQGRHWTRAEALRHPLFWLVLPAMIGPPAWGTALFFQQVHLVTVKGWALADFVALFPIFTLGCIAATFAAGALIDRLGTGKVMAFYMLPFAAAFLVIALTPSIAGAGFGLLIFALGSGIQATLPGAFWAEFYGTRHLGSIKAAAVAVMVLGSAIGPGVSGALIDIGLNFPGQAGLYSVYFIVAGAISFWAVRRFNAAA